MRAAGSVLPPSSPSSRRKLAVPCRTASPTSSAPASGSPASPRAHRLRRWPGPRADRAGPRGPGRRLLDRRPARPPGRRDGDRYRPPVRRGGGRAPHRRRRRRRTLNEPDPTAAYATDHDNPRIPFWPPLFANVTVRLLSSDDFPASARRQAVSDPTAAAACRLGRRIRPPIVSTTTTWLRRSRDRRARAGFPGGGRAVKYVILIHSNPDPWGHPTSAYTAEGRAVPPDGRAQRPCVRRIAGGDLGVRGVGDRRGAGRPGVVDRVPLR